MSREVVPPQPESHELARLRSRLVEMEQAAAERERELVELRRNDMQLRQAEKTQQQLIAAIESSLDFIATATADGKVTYVNAAGRQMVGLDDMEQVRRTVIPNYFTEEDAAFALQHILPIVMRDGKWEGDFRFRHMKTGQTVPIFYSVFIVKDTATGEVLGLGTVTRNITAQKQAEAEQQRLKDEIIRVQEAALAELSTPLIPLSDHVLVMPLIGSIDERRAQRVIETLLHGVSARQAQVAIIDVTGVSTVDTRTADVLIRAAKSAQLLGASVVLTGIRADVAQTLIQLGVDLSRITTRATLQAGIAYAMRHQ